MPLHAPATSIVAPVGGGVGEVGGVGGVGEFGTDGMLPPHAIAHAAITLAATGRARRVTTLYVP